MYLSVLIFMLFRQFLSVKEDPYKKGQNLGCQKNYRGEGVVVGEEGLVY